MSREGFLTQYYVTIMCYNFMMLLFKGLQIIFSSPIEERTYKRCFIVQLLFFVFMSDKCY